MAARSSSIPPCARENRGAATPGNRAALDCCMTSSSSFGRSTSNTLSTGLPIDAAICAIKRRRCGSTDEPASSFLSDVRLAAASAAAIELVSLKRARFKLIAGDSLLLEDRRRRMVGEISSS